MFGVRSTDDQTPFWFVSSDPKDVASLLTRAGLSMLTVDVEEITIAYPSMWELLSDLKDMGETNAIFGRCVVLLFPGIPLEGWPTKPTLSRARLGLVDFKSTGAEVLKNHSTIWAVG